MSRVEGQLASYLNVSNWLLVWPGVGAAFLLLALIANRGPRANDVLFFAAILPILGVGFGLWRFYRAVEHGQLDDRTRAWGWLASYVFNGTGWALGIVGGVTPLVLGTQVVFLMPMLGSAWGLALAVGEHRRAGEGEGELAFAPVRVKSMGRRGQR